MSAPTKTQIAGLAAAAVLIPAAAFGETVSASLPVSVTVPGACQVTATPLNFGAYDPTAASDVDSTASIQVLCTVGTSYTVALGAGAGTGATISTRRMMKGTDALGYALYQDASRTINWGETPGTDTPPATTAGATAASHTVYGRIAGGQNVPGGAYTDTVTVTVNY